MEVLMKNASVVVALILLIVISVMTGCSLLESESDDIPPFERLVGTISFDDYSAVISLDIGRTKATVSSSSFSVTGWIRYREHDFVLSGTFNSADGAVEAASDEVDIGGVAYSFTIVGTLAGTTLNGTATRIRDGQADANSGSVSAIGSSSQASENIKHYLGTFGGQASGTWNMSISPDNSIAGSYSGTTADGSYTSGTFLGTRSGTAISVYEADNVYGGMLATGVISDEAIAGTWQVEQGWQGVWSGYESTASGDPHVNDGGEPVFYRYLITAGLLYGALTSVDVPALGTYSNDDESVTAVAEMTGEFTSHVVFTINGYTDGVSGITIASGTITYEYDASSGIPECTACYTDVITFNPSTVMGTLQFTIEGSGDEQVCTLLRIDGVDVDTSIMQMYFY
jgi:hypothetical protein